MFDKDLISTIHTGNLNGTNDLCSSTKTEERERGPEDRLKSRSVGPNMWAFLGHEHQKTFKERKK